MAQKVSKKKAGEAGKADGVVDKKAGGVMEGKGGISETKVGKVVMTKEDGRQLRLSVEQGYVSPRMKAEGSKVVIREGSKGIKSDSGKKEVRFDLEVEGLERGNKERDIRVVEENYREELKKVRKEWEFMWSEEEKKVYDQIEEIKAEDRFKDLRIRMLEEKMEGFEKKWKDVSERIEIMEKKFKILEERATEVEVYSERSRGSGTSREDSVSEDSCNRSYRSGKSYWGSRSSIDRSEALSERDVGKIKKLINEKERDERRLNIVIRGVEVEGGPRQWSEKVQELIKGKLGVEGLIMNVRKRGRVLLVKLAGEEDKRKIMENKHKLRGERIFIEHDMSWEDRIVQSKLSAWARIRKERGEDVKVGVGRVRVRGIWKTWEDIEREVGKERKEDDQNKAGKVKVQEEGSFMDKVERWIVRSRKEGNEIVEAVGRIRINGAWKTWKEIEREVEEEEREKEQNEEENIGNKGIVGKDFV